MIANWPCPLAGGGSSDELVLRMGGVIEANEGSNETGGKTQTRILIIPPLFDEHNKLRRFLVETMRRLAEAGIETALPDLPGCNESLEPLETQTVSGWRDAVRGACVQMQSTHVLAVRSGAILAPATSKGWALAPHSGAGLLRAMIRAHVIASKEAGEAVTSDMATAQGRSSGITLAGWPLSPDLFQELEAAEPIASADIATFEQAALGGRALWLRAEPDYDPAQANALATLILEDLGKPE